ncbi:MAG: hypothetical protein ABIC91_02120 [Nanoarchaeota archaeon]|nr:hypothetical protein [Nanoarchaeota archaeon]MBU1030164.1 hypothetical protein [Nanoarchaeota archaeon]MBU1849393.1 hypothetical protein [Nanoarchaeota archaeon]
MKKIITYILIAANSLFLNRSAEKEDINNDSTRTIDLCLAYENDRDKEFEEALKKANETLKPYNLKVELKEKDPIQIPTKKQYSHNDLITGIRNSCTDTLDHYFTLMTGDLSSKKTNQYIISNMRNKTTIIDSDCNEELLEKIIVQEILRLFTTKKEFVLTEENMQEYFKKISEEKITKKHSKQFTKHTNEIEKGKDRTLTINMGLDNVSEETARRLIENSSKNYYENFGIKLELKGIYQTPIGTKFGRDKEYNNLIDAAKEKSDIYIILTNQDWSQFKKNSYSTPIGQAEPYKGFCWVETIHEEKMVQGTVNHEIAHLFGAPHVYLKNAVLTPQAHNQQRWAPGTRKVILQNKYKTWNRY